MYINWGLAPEGADKLMQDLNEIYWGNAKGEWFDTDDMTWNKPLSKNHVTIATRPQPRKTVEDAVEWVNNGNEICGRLFTQNKMLSFSKANNIYAFVSEASSAGSVETENWQPVCTREEFEACVAAKRETEWTHMHGPNPCKVIKGPNAYGQHVIEYKREGDWLVVMGETLKPIKPTITEDAKKQLEFYVQYRVDKYGDYAMNADLRDYLTKHEITD